LIEEQGKNAYSSAEDSPEFLSWKSAILEVIPNLNHDIVINLALHLAFDAKVNDKQIWRAIEDSAISSLHHLSLTQISQLEWATME
jgi:hypothetical protein